MLAQPFQGIASDHKNTIYVGEPFLNLSLPPLLIVLPFHHCPGLIDHGVRQAARTVVYWCCH